MTMMISEIYDALRDTRCGNELARAAARAAARCKLDGNGDMHELYDALVAAGCREGKARGAQYATVRALTGGFVKEK